ncbi:MAG TPA: hypothetical protein VHI13_18685 [Candidatus Kapabacteria bacterium]|nr:hypothetical protein [Candidatus Kapabacteria bacterium]
MRPTRLNLAALRSNIVPRSRRPRDIEEVIAQQGGPALSRREMLGLVGGATLAATPAVASVRTMLADGFEVVTGRDRVALMLGGQERWAIDARAFAGSPRLTVERTERRIAIELAGARYPGTGIPADLRCEIRPGLVRRMMSMEMAFGGFSCSMQLERWLLGLEPARSRVRLPGHDCPFETGAGITLSGKGVASFTPDWCLDLEGGSIAALSGFGGAVRADAAQIALPDGAAPSLLDDRPERRTLVSLERGEQRWGIDPGVRDFGGWNFRGHGESFDSVRAEFAEHHDGRTESALVADGAGGNVRVEALMHDAYRNIDGAPFGIALRNVRYAVAFNGSGRHAAVVANYSAEPAWLHTDGVSVLLGDDEEHRLFELSGANGAVESQDVSPAMLATVVPLAGAAITRPAALPKGTRLAVVNDSRPEILAGHSNHIAFNPNQPDDTPSMLLGKAAAIVVRPSDLVFLVFAFVGMKLSPKSGTGKATYERTGGDAKILVGFQPQNIAEEAFFETASGYPVAAGNPSDPDKSSDGKDGTPAIPAPYAPPVRARMAGPSRLVFNVPPEVSSIETTLEDLLKYCGQMPMNVAPHALPPKDLSWHLVAANTYTLSGASKFLGNSYKMQLAAMKGESLGTKGVALTTPGKLTGAQQLIMKSRSAALEKMDMSAGKAFKVSDSDIEKMISVDYGSIAVTRPEFRAPKLDETAIESPYRLYISPNRYGAWAHAVKPVYGIRTGRVELWHSRLGVRDGSGVDEDDPRLRTIRAIWATDLDKLPPGTIPDHSNDPFRMSLDSFDRINIAALSSDFNLTGPSSPGKLRPPYLPLPIATERLMLSSLGAWMNVRGLWPRDTMPLGFSVEEWTHRAAMGRDTFVRVVYAGFLYPFGHYASVIKITERKFQPHPANPAVKVAYLRQRMFIVVRQPEVTLRVSGLAIKDFVTGTDGINIDLQMPFTSARITTLITPNLDPPELSEIWPGKKQGAFWPRVNNQDFQFHMVLKDVDGNHVELTMPLVFIGKEENDRPSGSTLIPNISVQYEKAANKDRRERPVNGQRVAYTESVKPGDTQFATDTIVFGVQSPTGATYDAIPSTHPRYFPVVRRADLRIPAAQHLTGNNNPTSVVFADLFLKEGYLGGNPGQVFFQLLPGKELSFDFNAKGDRSGGLVKPNMKISALSRLSGPIAGDNAVSKFGASGQFNPKDFFGSFGGIQAKLFGVIDIWDIIDAIGVDKSDLIPKFVTEALNVVEGFLQDIETFLGYVDEVKKAGGTIATVMTNLKTDIQNVIAAKDDLTTLPSAINTFITHFNALPGGYITVPSTASMQDGIRREAEKKLNQFRQLIDSGAAFLDAVQNFAKAIEMAKEMKVKFEWKPELHDWGFDAGHPLFIANNKGTKAVFLISVEVRARTNGNSSPSIDVICGLENFTLDLIAPASFIKLYFDKVEFVATAGKKPEVNVGLANIEFVGVLSFVEALRSLIPLDGFSDPPGIDVSADGITASYSVSLPNIAFGVFSLQNISLGAGFCIPFIGQPLSVNFNFCTRENPFLLTVSMIGGGGFFGLTIDPGGVQILEASFEFGASLALDFGVASGEVHIMAGIYFKMQAGECTLTGYLRIGGSVDVLGLITASIELKMELTYEFSSGKCVGGATLTIEVEVLFFSASVEISCERKFAGSNGDPSFRALMEPEDTWHPWDDYCEAFA